MHDWCFKSSFKMESWFVGVHFKINRKTIFFFKDQLSCIVKSSSFIESTGIDLYCCLYAKIFGLNAIKMITLTFTYHYRKITKIVSQINFLRWVTKFADIIFCMLYFYVENFCIIPKMHYIRKHILGCVIGYHKT